MNVLVTGSASGFAQLLLARLAAEPGIDLILGVDQRESAFTHERYVQVLLDLRSPLLARVFTAIGVVGRAPKGFLDSIITVLYKIGRASCRERVCYAV